MKAIMGAIVVLAGAIMITGAMLSKENTATGSRWNLLHP